jgi:hypothetical protein
LLSCVYRARLQRTTGAFYALLQKLSFDESVFCCQRSAVTTGTLTDDEFILVKNNFKPLIANVEARNRVVSTHMRL